LGSDLLVDAEVRFVETARSINRIDDVMHSVL
jgi:hypothetical protein